MPASLRAPRPDCDTIAGAGYKINLLPRRPLSYARNDGFDLRVTGLDPRKFYRVQRFRINDVWDFRLLSTVTLKGGDVRIAQTLAPPSIELLAITHAAAP